MRLDFNYVIIDDDYNSHDESVRDDFEDLLSSINDKIKEKGLDPCLEVFATIKELDEYSNNYPDKLKRCDLFLSDNNIQQSQTKENSDGLELYFSLRENFLCDFILYTRDSKNSIIEMLRTKLQAEQDPNLFSRFTFVPHTSDELWLSPILDLIDHTVSKREEMNNLRGLYAQLTAKIDKHLRSQFNLANETNFKNVIEKAYQKESSLERTFPKNKLHHIREIRNGLLHNNEELSNDGCYVLKYTKKGRPCEIREDDLQKFRKMIKEAEKIIK